MEGDVADKDSVIRTRLQQLHEENERLQQVSIATAAAPLTSSTPRVTTSAASHASGDRNSSNDDELLQVHACEFLEEVSCMRKAACVRLLLRMFCGVHSITDAQQLSLQCPFYDCFLFC